MDSLLASPSIGVLWNASELAVKVAEAAEIVEKITENLFFTIGIAATISAAQRVGSHYSLSRGWNPGFTTIGVTDHPENIRALEKELTIRFNRYPKCMNKNLGGGGKLSTYDTVSNVKLYLNEYRVGHVIW